MKVLSVLGAPRRNGNTERLLEQYMKGVRENNSDVEISDIILRDKKLEGCRGCEACWNEGHIGKCVIRDDMQDIYEEMNTSDIILLASPIYHYSLGWLMKLFIDRWFPFAEGGLKGKKVVLLTTFAEKDEESSGAVLITEMLKRTCRVFGLEFLYHYGVSVGRDIKFVTNNEKVSNELYDLGKELVK